MKYPGSRSLCQQHGTTMIQLALVSTFLVLVAPATPSPAASAASYISSCHYFGSACGHRVGDFESSGMAPDEDDPFVRVANSYRNISCGSSAANATEYCSLRNSEYEPDLNKFQCFSIYSVNTTTPEIRQLVAAGCIFNHALELCTGHACLFSHEVKLSVPGKTLQYCCCHSSDECNRGRIIGGPMPGPTQFVASAAATVVGVVSAATTQSETNNNGSDSSAVATIVGGSLLGVSLISLAVLLIHLYRWSKRSGKRRLQRLEDTTHALVLENRVSSNEYA